MAWGVLLAGPARGCSRGSVKFASDGVRYGGRGCRCLQRHFLAERTGCERGTKRGSRRDGTLSPWPLLSPRAAKSTAAGSPKPAAVPFIASAFVRLDFHARVFARSVDLCPVPRLAEFIGNGCADLISGEIR